MFIPEDDIFLTGTFYHESRFYIYGPSYDFNQLSIILYSMDIDGSNRTRLQIPVHSTAYTFNVIDLHINGEGNLSFILHEFFRDYSDSPDNPDEPNDEDEYDFIYKFSFRSISLDGELVSSIDIQQLNDFTDGKPWFFILDAAFTPSGNVVFLVNWHNRTVDVSENGIFIFSDDFAEEMRMIEKLPNLLGRYLIKTFDGRIFVDGYQFENNSAISSLYEIDYLSGTLSALTRISTDTSHVTTAPEGSTFDFYIIVGHRVSGYCIKSEEMHQMLNTDDLGIPYNPGFRNGVLHPFFVFGNDEIMFLMQEWDENTRTNALNFYLLTPSDEPFSDDREVITIGGLGNVSQVLQSQIASFNRQNQSYRIEYIDYGIDGLTRLQTEVMVGRGPDMIKLSWRGLDLVTPFAESGFLYDLYPLIDADPVLNRDNFFPSVLSIWENSSGELMQIASAFSMQTIIGRATEFPTIPDSWTYSDFIDAYYILSAEHPAPFGLAFSRYDFLSKTVFVDDTFFSFERGEAYFTSEAFIEVLEAAKTIPAYHNVDAVTELVREGEWDVIGNLMRGEQLLGAWQNTHGFRDYIRLKHRLGDFRALGYPAQNTPLHGAQVSLGNSIGINANSPNIEAAWEFVRMGMLPDVMAGMGSGPFYTRIDLFDRELGRQLERKEPLNDWWLGSLYKLPPLTEADADFLREMISNIGFNLARQSPVYDIVHEEVPRFFEGNRSAEDTARVIQNRVQTYLNEQR
jgi:hypothetical protein